MPFFSSSGKSNKKINDTCVNYSTSTLYHENLTLWEYHYRNILKYGNIQGRARRKEFCGFLLFYSLIPLILYLIVDIIYSIIYGITEELVKSGIFLATGYFLFGIYPFFSIASRRFSDLGKSGWKIIWFFFSHFFVILMLVICAVWGTDIDDIDISNWDVLLGFLAIFSIISLTYLIILIVKSGDKGKNKYGEDPKRQVEQISTNDKKFEMKEHYTYADYLTWDDEVRYELIDGVPCALAAPNRNHQRILREISLIIGNYLKGKTCEMYFAPTDIRLFPKEENDDFDVYQPDLFVVCDESKWDNQSFKGTPDFIIEITSPSTDRKDKFVKYHKYLQARVPEYWIIDPENRTVSVFILDNGRYMHSIFGGTEKLKPAVLDGCVIDLAEVFASIGRYEDKD